MQTEFRLLPSSGEDKPLSSSLPHDSTPCRRCPTCLLPWARTSPFFLLARLRFVRTESRLLASPCGDKPSCFPMRGQACLLPQEWTGLCATSLCADRVPFACFCIWGQACLLPRAWTSLPASSYEDMPLRDYAPCGRSPICLHPRVVQASLLSRVWTSLPASSGGDRPMRDSA